MNHIGVPIKPGKFYLLDSFALEREAPWTHDWGVDVDAIVFVSKVYYSETAGTTCASIYFNHQITGSVPVTCLRTFQSMKIMEMR